MGTKEKTLGTLAKYARRAGERRVKRLEAVISYEHTPESVREWAKNQKREILSAIQGTRQYAKDGHRYKSKTQNYIRKQVDRLNAAIKKVAPNYMPPRGTFATTQQQLNLASSKRTEQASIYTKQEVQIFYRIHQKLWDKEGVGEHDRNEAILKGLNEERKKMGLRPLTLAEAVEATIAANKEALKLQQPNPEKEMTKEQREIYEKAQQLDDEDSAKNSPTSPSVVKLIKSAFETIFNQVDVTKLETSE